VLVVDDYEPFRRFVNAMLKEIPQLQVVGEAADGFEAVRKANELQPDLMLLDIGLPGLNGIEAARRIRVISPECQIIFVSLESSADVMEEALDLGALSYVAKERIGSELRPFLEAVILEKQLLSARPGNTELHF
jgi:DNA-binding NarL/FixJ family response regulator